MMRRDLFSTMPDVLPVSRPGANKTPPYLGRVRASRKKLDEYLRYVLPPAGRCAASDQKYDASMRPTARRRSHRTLCPPLPAQYIRLPVHYARKRRTPKPAEKRTRFEPKRENLPQFAAVGGPNTPSFCKRRGTQSVRCLPTHPAKPVDEPQNDVPPIEPAVCGCNLNVPKHNGPSLQTSESSWWNWPGKPQAPDVEFLPGRNLPEHGLTRARTLGTEEVVGRNTA